MRLPATVITGLTLCALAGPGPAQAARGGGDLYLQQAGGGTLTGSKLVLRGVGARTTSFTDRPARRASSLTTRAFAKGFGASFRGDPPNAALQIDGGSRGRDLALLEIRRPRYDARKRTLTYSVKRLRTTRARGLKTLATRADRGISGRFGRATLFVDPGGAGVPVRIALLAPPNQVTALSLGNGASFDVEGGTPGLFQQNGQSASNPVLSITPSSLSLQGPTNGPANGSVLLSTLVDVFSPAITGTAAIPSGGEIVVTVNDVTTSLSGGPFSLSTNSSGRAR